MGPWVGRRPIVEFFSQMGDFLFSGTGKMPVGTDRPLLVFAISSGIIGVLVVTLDFLMSLIGRDSLLNLTHNWKTLPVFILIWGFGAAGVSFLGAGFSVLEVTLQAAVIAGIAWPVLMTRIVSSADGKAEPEEISVPVEISEPEGNEE